MIARYLLLAVLVLAGPRLASAQEKDTVVQSIADEKLEGVLRGMRIELQRVGTTKGVTLWSYKHNGFTMRLINFNGKELMIDAEFPVVPWEAVNDWNMKTKWTRACLKNSEQGEYTLLESNLDLKGGVTEGAIKQFVANFDVEVNRFKGTFQAAAGEEEVFPAISVRRLEGILKNLKIDFKRDGSKGDVSFYRFESDKQLVQLANFGGKDLMIWARFPALAYPKINEWNATHRYVRVVRYPSQDEEPDVMVLTASLDCAAGSSDAIIRHFLAMFDKETRLFKKFAAEQ